jgi:hypothetical protein
VNNTIRSASGQIIAPRIGVDEKTDLIRKVRTFRQQFRVRGTLTLAGGPATLITNGGSILAAFSKMGYDENGARFVEADPRLLQIAHQMVAPRDTDLGRVRATNLANGAYALEESIFLPFANVQVAGPAESIYMERNPQQSFQAFVNQKTANGALGNIVQTPGTAVWSAMTVDTVQRYDLDRTEKTTFLPVIRQVELVVPGASAEFIFKIESPRYLQWMIFQQDTSGAGEVVDIINSLAIRADARDYIGPGLVPYENLQADAQMDLAGDCVSRGYFPFWLREGGRLSNIVNVNSLSNLRAVMNVQPSVTANAGTSTIRILLGELEAVPGLTMPPRGYQV